MCRFSPLFCFILLFSSSVSLLHTTGHFFCEKERALTCPFVFEGMLLLRQLYFVCEGVPQCNVRFDAENLKVAISPTEAVQVEKGKRVTHELPREVKDDLPVF